MKQLPNLTRHALSRFGSVDLIMILGSIWELFFRYSETTGKQKRLWVYIMHVFGLKLEVNHGCTLGYS